MAGQDEADQQHEDVVVQEEEEGSVGGEETEAGEAAQEEVEGEEEEDPLKKRNILTPEERRRALNIKEAIEQDPDVKSLCDFWYAQFAIIDGDNVEKSVERARNLQYFREEYDILDNHEYGTRIGREFQRLLPEFWMSMDFNERDGNYVLFIDLAGYLASVITAAPANTRAWMAATYYMNGILSPDLEAIRKGPVVLCENEGFDWKKNFGLNLYKKLWVELNNVYPWRVRLKNFHNGSFMTVIVGMCRGFLDPDVYERIELGCQSGQGHLGRIFMTPTVEAANERFLHSCSAALKRRYESEASFFL